LEIEVLLVRLRTILLLKKVGNTFQTLIFYDCAMDSDGIFFISQHHQAHNSLAHRGWQIVFLEEPNFFICPIHFYGGWKVFQRGRGPFRPPSYRPEHHY